MKKVFFAIFISFNCNASGVYFDYKNQNIDFDKISLELNGLSAGYSLMGDENVFIGLESLKDSNNISYFSFFIEINKKLYEDTKTSISFSSNLGVGQLSVPWFNNKIFLLSIPIGLNAKYFLAENMLFNIEVGYQYFIDLTDSTKCRDGSYSNSIGSGACSYHNGVSSYQDKIGDGGGIYYKFGLNYYF